eukprot:g17257.t1
MTSTAIFTCYRQLHPPTGVDHAVFGSVTAAGSRDLVVAKAFILELYRVHRDDPKDYATAAASGEVDGSSTAFGDGGNDDDATGFYLELAGTFPLAGNITSLAIIPVAAAAPTATPAAASTASPPPPQQQQDILVVSFGDAKMALVAYDALLGRLETVSIHNFDAAAIGPGAAGIESGYGLASALKDRPATISAADPAGRCLAAVVAGCQLVVLPARRHIPRSVFVSEEAAERRRILRPFTIDLEEAGVTGFIKAAAFLEGFHEPALALLYEPIQTCAGRLASKRSTCRLVVFSINLTQGRAPSVWQVDSLPHDSWDLVAVPSPVGGVQVISTNAVMHVNQSEVRSILAVNGYARATVEPALLGCPLRGGDSDWGWASFRRSHSEREVVDLSSYDVCVELDVVKCVFLTPTSMFLSLRTGEVYALRLHLAAAIVAPGTRAGGGGGAPNRVVGQSMRPVGRASPCSVLAVSAAAGFGRGGDSDRVGGNGGGDGASTGLVFMGSRVGDSLLVKYAVASAGTQPGKRGKEASDVGAAGLMRELKVEAENEEREGVGGGGGAANGVVGGGEEAVAAAAAAASSATAAAAAEGGASSDPTVGLGRGAVAIKEEPKEAAGLTGMDVANSVGNGRGGGSAAADPSSAEADASKDAATSTATATAAAGGSGAAATGETTPPDADTPAPAPATGAGKASVASQADADGIADSTATATAAATPTRMKRPEIAREEGEGDANNAVDSGGSGNSSSSSSGKRGRGERSPSPGEGEGNGGGGGGDGEGARVAADEGEDEDNTQPDKKRSRVSSSAAAGTEDPAVSPADIASPSDPAAEKEGVPRAVEGGERGCEPPGTPGAKPTASPEENGDPAKAIDALDTTSPMVVTDGTAENFYGENEETTKLIREELEMIHEEEDLYGARLGSARAVGTRGGRAPPLSTLGSKVSERVIEAVGFRLKVVDSICSLGPIVDAALVPSAYHVPKTRVPGSGRRAAAAGGSSGGGATSGGGIRTSLVVVELSVPGATGVYTSPEGSGRAGGSRNRDTLVLVSCSSSPPPPQTPLDADADAVESGPGHTRVLAFEEDARVVELADGAAGNPFVCDAATADVCVMAGGTVVQAHAQGLRVTRDRAAVFDVLASDDPEFGGLGAEPGVSVVRAAAAGSHACCLLSNLRLHLMALDDGDLMPLLPSEEEEEEGGSEGSGGGGVWEEVEAMFMFGVQERANTSSADVTATAASHPAETAGDFSGNGSMSGGSGGGRGKAVGSGLFLEAAPPGDACRSQEEENLGGGGSGGLWPGEHDDDDSDDDDNDGGDGGDDSDAEEWATLYGAEPGRGILNPCSIQSPNGGGGGPVNHRRQSGDGAVSDGFDAAAAPDGLGEAETQQDKQRGRGGRGQGLEKGWWGGAAWGGTGSKAASAEAVDDDGEEVEDTTSAYLVVCRKGGALEVFSCEGQGAEGTRARPVFRASGAALAPSTLWNELLLPPVAAESAAATSSEEGEEEEEDGDGDGSESLANGGGAGGGRSPVVDGDGEDGGVGALAVATGVVVANGRRGSGAARRGTVGAVAEGEGRANGSSAGAAGAGAGVVEGPTPVSRSDPMEVDGASPDATAAAAAAAAGGEEGDDKGAVAVLDGGNKESEEDGVACPAVEDVIVHPVGAVDGPAELRRLVLALYLDNGSLLVYEARMSISSSLSSSLSSPSSSPSLALRREQVVCFSKLCHDLIARPVKGIPPEAAVPNPARGRALRTIRSAAGQEGICFARPGCRSALILAERGAVCVSAVAQDDLGDGSGNPPLPPGAPPSWAGIGLGSVAPLYNPDAFPNGRGGGFAGITAGGGRLRFISAAPAASQLVTPGTSGGGGLGGGGQGHFVAEKVRLGATVHGLIHLPHQLAQPGKTGDILKQLLRGRGHYVALLSTTEDALAEQPKTGLSKGEGEGEELGDGDDDEEEEAAGLLDRHIVKHKNWTVADPSLGGAPPLLVPSFELRVVALAPGSTPSVDSAASRASAPEPSSSSATEADNDDKSGSGGGGGGSSGGSGGKAGGGEAGAGGAGNVSGQAAEAALLLSAETVESHPMDFGENGICMTLVRLEQGGSPRMYVAVGTGMNEPQGEDKAARGRLLLFEVDYAYLAREDGKHEHAVKLRQVFAKEQLGPVTGESGPVSAVAQLGRHLILSVGKKVIVNRWDPKSCTLELIGFHDPRVYVISLSVIKNRFILVGDAYGSVQLVVWREEDHSLTALSKDHEDCQVFSTEYLIDEPGMAIVVADGRRNIKVLQYAPNATNSRGGTKLLCQSDFYLGSRVAKLTRRRTRGNLRDGARYCLLAGTLDGGLGAILPVDERVFRRLYALQGIMSNALSHNGAANPRAYRLFDHGPTFRYETKQNMLDGSLLWRFVGLDARTQHDLTRAIGTTVDRVMANLLDIDLASLF